MSNIKSFKKGDFLFKEGDKLNCLYIVQSGQVSLLSTRSKKNLELTLVSGANQILGESVLFGSPQQTFSAVATSETKVLELPMDVIKTPMESLPQVVKMILKSLTD